MFSSVPVINHSAPPRSQLNPLNSGAAIAIQILLPSPPVGLQYDLVHVPEQARYLFRRKDNSQLEVL